MRRLAAADEKITMRDRVYCYFNDDGGSSSGAGAGEGRGRRGRGVFTMGAYFGPWEHATMLIIYEIKNNFDCSLQLAQQKQLAQLFICR